MPDTDRVIRRKPLGFSGVDIPEIGFGTWRYSGGVEPLQTAIERGAAFIDTAETYGSEGVVGQAIRGKRAKVFLGSKVRPANFRKRDLLNACENSLRRLGTDYLDLYQLHWPNHCIPIGETMSTMEQLADSGKIRLIGVSNFSAEELESAQQALSKHRIASNQVRYSLIERTIEDDLLEYCQRQHITVIAFSPLGSDFVSLRNSDPEGLFLQLSRKYRKTIAQLALNWVVAKNGVVTIPRASSPPHVIEDCGASGWTLSDSDYRMLSEKIRYRCRGRLERTLRRWGRHVAQTFNRAV